MSPPFTASTRWPWLTRTWCEWEQQIRGERGERDYYKELPYENKEMDVACSDPARRPRRGPRPWQCFRCRSGRQTWGGSGGQDRQLQLLAGHDNGPGWNHGPMD